MSRKVGQTPATAMQAWNEGFEANHTGVSETNSPYPFGDDRHLSWNDGWAAAEGEHEEK